ncbi:MAG: MASE3 domain-containing protein, partial [bacterium]
MAKLMATLNKYTAILAGALILSGLYVAGLFIDLPFHSLTQLFGVLVAGGIFMMTWNSRRFQDNGCFLFLGMAYLFVGIFDLVHVLAYLHIGAFRDYSLNISIQIRMASRYLESVSLFMAPFFLDRKIKVHYLVIGFTSGAIPEFPANLVLLKAASIVGVYWGDWAARNPGGHAGNLREMA